MKTLNINPAEWAGADAADLRRRVIARLEMQLAAKLEQIADIERRMGWRRVQLATRRANFRRRAR